MHIINQRYSQGNNSTQGLVFKKLESGWDFFAHIIEDDATGPHGDYRLPAGIYKLRIHPIITPKTLIFQQTSMKYLKRFIEVVDYVNPPRFGVVFFHVGNDQNDTEMCQLLNDRMANNKVYKEKEGSESTAATQRFYELVYPVLERGEEVIYEVRDEIKLWS